MKNVKDYQDGSKYEIFIRRAFKYGQNHRGIGSWNTVFGKVKNKVESAIDKFLSRRINKEERESLLLLKTKLQTTNSKENLIEVINEALTVTRRHK